ncbi:MAG: hypothetical protein JO180_10000 [Gemmatirosa sp.]|nr:hypothetical protein [Gemmatirosa sp.]
MPPRSGGHLGALAVCTAAALLLLWPLLAGRLLLGGARSDMYIAGYAFRRFGAETFLRTGAIPQWNPYIFGGLPYVGAMHGDVFYPTAWLRWILPVDVAITWGMALHVVLAGWLAYRFGRALGLSWGAATIAGVAYELTGIVASQMSPGHDGKLFVSALTPLAFWTLLAAVRDRRAWAYGAFAVVVALLVLGHYHMAYFLLLALGSWAVFLACVDPARPRDVPPWRPLGIAAAAVVVGLGISAIQVLPFLAYVPFSPRAAGGPDTGWAFATSYAMPPSELFTLLLPQFNGVLEHYWGRNAIKFHTEYVGFLPLALAVLALGDRARRRLVVALAGGALLFLLLAFGGHTPFYRPLFTLLPLVDKIRAMGMVFWLVAFLVCTLAGIGAERVLARTASPRTVLALVAAGLLFATLGASGGLQGLAESLAIPERFDAVDANAPYLRAGALRLLFFVALGGGVLWATAAGRLTRRVATAALLAVVALDLWSVDRQFFTFSPRASTVFADDAVTAYLKRVRLPYRVVDAQDSYGYSILMGYGVPVARGYHGFELRRYDELAGARAGWSNLYSQSLLDLLAVRFVILREPHPGPGYHEVVGQTATTLGTTAVLYERDAIPPYARVLPSSAKLDEAQAVATLADPRYPVNGVALLPDSSTATSPPARPPFPPSAVSATVRAWEPGRMTIALEGADAHAGHLVVAENWYPDWHAEVDGRAATVRRVDYTLLGVDLPAGAREVRLWFDSPAYARGRMVSGVSLLAAIAMTLVPVVRRLRPV